MSDQQPYVPYDPEVDQPSMSQPTENKNASMTFSVSLTPKKLFFGGFVLGLLVMAIPMAYTAARAGLLPGGSGTIVAAPSGAPSPSAPSVPPNGNAAGPVKPVSKDDHLRGAKNPEFIMIEYSDLECPFCQRFHTTAKQALEEYKDKAAWVYRHYPLSFHANAQKEAEASECVAELGGADKYWKYIDTIFERTTANGTGFALDALAPLAKEVGVNEGKFKECLDGGKMTARVNKDLQEGQTAGVDGTPGTVLFRTKDKATRLVAGALPYEDFKREIEALLNQ